MDDLTKPGSDQIRLNPTGTNGEGDPRVHDPERQGLAFYAYISNYGFGPANTLYIRSLKLTDLSAGAGANGRAGRRPLCTDSKRPTTASSKRT